MPKQNEKELDVMPTPEERARDQRLFEHFVNGMRMQAYYRKIAKEYIQTGGRKDPPCKQNCQKCADNNKNLFKYCKEKKEARIQRLIRKWKKPHLNPFEPSRIRATDHFPQNHPQPQQPQPSII